MTSPGAVSVEEVVEALGDDQVEIDGHLYIIEDGEYETRIDPESEDEQEAV